MIRKNDQLIVTISELTYAGLGFVKVNEFPVFVYNALPTEKVTIQILKVLKKYAFARVINFFNYSIERNEEINYTDIQTGLAPLSHLKYESQLKFKDHQIFETLHKFNIDSPIEPIIGSPKKIRYRNKAQIPVRSLKDKLEVGFFRAHSHHLVITNDFLLQEEIIDRNILKIRDILRNFHAIPYDEKSHKGTIRNIMFII